MRAMTTYLVLGAAVLAGGLAAVDSAGAKTPRRYHRPYYANAAVTAKPPLTVNKRSFLDPGPVVPVGSESAYMVQNTYFAGTADQGFAHSKFGNEALPRPLETPGRSGPVFQFETPGEPF